MTLLRHDMRVKYMEILHASILHGRAIFAASHIIYVYIPWKLKEKSGFCDMTSQRKCNLKSQSNEDTFGACKQVLLEQEQLYWD